MAITALPTPPSRDDAANFSDRADAFLGALPVFVTEANAQAAAVNGNAAAAAASATSALNAPGTSATSVTSLTIGTGAKTLAIQTGKAYAVGQFVMIARTSAPANWMHGQITAHNSTTGSLTVQVGFAAGSGTFTDWTIALTAPVITSSIATAAQIWAGTSTSDVITPAALIAASESQALAYAATITPNFQDGWNRHVTLTGNATLANPTNAKPGIGFRIRVQQDATGSRTLAFGSAWAFPGGAPSLSTTPNAIDIIAGFVHASGIIEASLIKALA